MAKDKMNFETYLEKQGYTKVTIKKTLPLENIITKAFPEGVPKDEFYVQETVYKNLNCTNKTKCSYRTLVRRYLEYLDYLKRNDISCLS
jgi:hypothetical protein